MAKLQSGSNVYGNLTVQTFLTVTGNVIGGNILTAGLVSATGNVTGGNIVSAGIISTSGNIFGGGIRSTSSGTAPASPSVGDFWYNTTTNVQYRFTFDGTSYYWIDDFGASAGVNGTFNAITNGTSNVSINVANGNTTVGIGGTSNVVVLANTGQYVTGIVSASGNITTAGFFVGTFAGNISGNLTVPGSNTQVIYNNSGNAGASAGLTFNTVGNVLSVTGNIAGGNLLTAGLISATSTITSAANIVGGNITTVGLVTATGNVTGGNILTSGLISATSTITSAANIIGGNITTVGLVSATGNVIGGNIRTVGLVSATGNVTGGNILTSGLISATSTITSAANIIGGNITTVGLISATGAITGAALTGTSLTVSTGNITVGNIVNANANGVGNIGNATTYFNTVFAKSTSAQYADLAETYISDTNYSPGTLVIFGGADEITASTQSHDTRVAGVISTAPAYLMNSGTVGLPVALTGRVPCSVVGTIRKGDRLVSSNIKGVATVLDSNKYLPGCIIGKSLEDYNSNSSGVIEVAVGRY